MPLLITKVSVLLLGLVSFYSLAAVDVVAPYVRAMPASAINSGAFMLLKNDSDKSVKLITASSDIANVLELHTHIKQGDMMQMRQVDFIEIKAHGQTELKPGGFHIMLMGLTKPLVMGEKIKLTLYFSDTSVKELQVPIKKIMGQEH